MKTTKDKAKVEVLFEDETEWYTDDIVRIDDEYYFRHQNGGDRGAYDERNFHPRCEIISRTEARRLALEWGEDPETVAEKLT